MAVHRSEWRTPRGCSPSSKPMKFRTPRADFRRHPIHPDEIKLYAFPPPRQAGYNRGMTEGRRIREKWERESRKDRLDRARKQLPKVVLFLTAFLALFLWFGSTEDFTWALIVTSIFLIEIIVFKVWMYRRSE
jgi:hypothetical protein